MYKIYLSCFVQYNKLQLRIKDNRLNHGYVPLLFIYSNQFILVTKQTIKQVLLTIEKNKC